MANNQRHAKHVPKSDGFLAFDDYVITVDSYRVGLDPHLRVYQAASGFDLEGPLMPGAAQDLAAAVDRDHAIVGRGRRFGSNTNADLARAQWTGLMRTEVAQRVESAGHIEHANTSLSGERRHNFALAWWDIRNLTDYDARHAYNCLKNIKCLNWSLNSVSFSSLESVGP